MNTRDQKTNQKDQSDANQRQDGVENTPGNAREREMGHADEPLGDLGHGKKTWEPPAGEQGMSNRADDAGGADEFDDDEDADDEIDGEDSEEAEEEVINQLKANEAQERLTGENDQKGGDLSNRAAQSGATGERKPLGAKNKPEPKDQDEKGMGHPRNR